MAHTPGDWVVHKNEDREFGLFSIYSDHPETCFAEVAELRLCEAGEMEPDGQGGSREFRSYHVSEEECEANAHLMAAAPKLLWHLQLILELSDRNDYETYFAAVRELATEAIAKATGKAVQR